MKKKYIVRLTEAECEGLKNLAYKGKVAAYRRTHAQILLWADESSFGPGLLDREVAKTVGVNESTVSRLCQRW